MKCPGSHFANVCLASLILVVGKKGQCHTKMKLRDQIPNPLIQTLVKGMSTQYNTDAKLGLVSWNDLSTYKRKSGSAEGSYWEWVSKSIKLKCLVTPSEYIGQNSMRFISPPAKTSRRHSCQSTIPLLITQGGMFQMLIKTFDSTAFLSRVYVWANPLPLVRQFNFKKLSLEMCASQAI